ncbi:MAG: FAD:protein FMN transferase [Bacilli bacterium]|nr:FAD:protein FMN transferase [Bacilli bacterium]
MKYLKYIGVFVIILLIVFYILFNRKMQVYTKDYFYMDTIITIKFYSCNKKESEEIIKDIDNIYREYHILTDRYNGYDNVNNIYYINNNNDDIGEIVLDSKLYDLISYADKLSDESNGLFDINLGGVIDVWKKYRDNGDGIPTLLELKKANKKNDVKLLDNNKILNNHPNIDLGAISKGYTTKMVAEYLESRGIKYFLINAGGNVIAGESYDKDCYKIGIQSPSDNTIAYALNSKNISVVTSGGYERNYIYKGVMYHHIISPKTLFPTNYMKSVTVVTKDSALGDYLSTTLFLMSIDDGMEFIKKYDAEALWIDNDDNLIFSEGFSRYEQK